MSEVIPTKFGNASPNKRGYYLITSTKDGNNGKLLHRLIYEDFHKVSILPGVIVHHKNENKSDNSIENLELMFDEEHRRHHTLGKPRPENCKIKQSKTESSTGIYRVIKQKGDYAQGFRWVYHYRKNGKRIRISSVDLDKLKDKVLAKGLKWIEFNATDTERI